MMDLILGTAKDDLRIRAVIMNGSRANPQAPKDFFQDYDIIYAVREMDSFLSDHGWVAVFGERMIMQMPKCGQLIPDTDDGSFTYLMQFVDGNRLDLRLAPVDKVGKLLQKESHSLLLLDKDNIIPPSLLTGGEDYLIKRPTVALFNDCCNEFWWICTYVAKGIWRDELPYAMEMFDRLVRDMLLQMLGWHIGVRTDFSVSVGKCGKYLKKYLEPELWTRYVQTYTDADYVHLWSALFTAGDLFRTIAKDVAGNFGFHYPHEDDRRVTAHLHHVQALPRTATEMDK